MGDLKWFKLSTDFVNNKKIRQIRQLPDAFSIIFVWVGLLSIAADSNENGFIYFTKDVPYTDQMLANFFDMPLTTIQLALKTFENWKMIEVVDDIICVSNWAKYQADELCSNEDEVERIREQSRKRVSEYRARQKQAKLEGQTTMDIDGCNVTGNVTCNVTGNAQSNNNIYNSTTISLSSESIINNQVPTVAGDAVYKLQLNDKSYYDVYQSEIDELKDIYPNADIDQEFKKMIRWIKDNPTKRKTRRGIGSFISNWLDKAQNKPRREAKPIERQYAQSLDSSKPIVLE